jgi:hypothetical protein
MKPFKTTMLIITFVLSACVTIPQETVILSETIGNDLKVLHNSHRNLIEMYYGKIKDDVNLLVDEVYAPFVIHYVLKTEFENYKKGDSSLFRTIETAAKVQGKIESENVLTEMVDFQTAAHWQISNKRDELMSPIISQESYILAKIDQSYENANFANSTITGYLKSIRKVKETQQEALSLIGFGGADTVITNSLLKLSELVNEVTEEAKNIDVKSDEAFKQFESISSKIKQLTDKE